MHSYTVQIKQKRLRNGTGSEKTFVDFHSAALACTVGEIVWIVIVAASAKIASEMPLPFISIMKLMMLRTSCIAG